MMQPEERKLLKDTHDTVTQLKALITGVNGQLGLADYVKRIDQNHKEDTATARTERHSISCRLNKLNLKFWMLVAGLVGSGILGGYGLLK